MSDLKVEVSVDAKHAAIGWVMCDMENGRSIATFWHQHDAENVAESVNVHKDDMDTINRQSDLIDELEERNRRVLKREKISSCYAQSQGLLAVEQADQIKMLREALNGVTNMWCELVNSGDAGRWDPETDKPVIAARQALAATEAK